MCTGERYLERICEEEDLVQLRFYPRILMEADYEYLMYYPSILLWRRKENMENFREKRYSKRYSNRKPPEYKSHVTDI